MSKIASDKDNNTYNTDARTGNEGRPPNSPPPASGVTFNSLPDQLKKIILDLEKNYKIIEIIDEGLIFYNTKYENLRKALEENYDANTLNFIDFMFTHNFQYYNDLRWLTYQPVLNHFMFFFPIEKEEKADEDPNNDKNNALENDGEKSPISTANENSPKDEKKEGDTGGSHPHPLQKGNRGAEIGNYKKLSDIPIQNVPGVLAKRKADFGITIGREALTHFESLKCTFPDNDPVFHKIEGHFLSLEYLTSLIIPKNGWITPIDNARRDKMGLCFGIQLHKNGHIKLHLNGKQKDIELFTQQFFEVFKPFLSDEEIIYFVELLLLARCQKPAFKVHNARHIGPKKIIDQKFKGATIKVNEVHWFGKIRYDARIDYSEPMKPHLECEGPAPQVGNALKLMDESFEYVANLSEVRELSYRTRDKVHENFQGIGQLSEITSKNGQVLLQVNEKVENGINELSSKMDEHHENTDHYLEKLYENTKQTSDDLGNSLMVMKEKFKEVKDHIEITANNNAQEINKASTKLSDEIKSLKKDITERFDSLQDLIITKFEDSRKDFQTTLKKTLTKIEEFSEEHSVLAAMRVENEIGKSETTLISYLQAELDKSRSTIYNYLNELQEKGLIISIKKKGRKGRGRPGKHYLINFQIHDLLKKERITIT